LGKPSEQLQPWEYASLPENIPKQRYPTPEDNLRCYDKTRVTLYKNPGEPFSDFIMANWVDSYAEKKRYIATQGPMESTINDFYRMVSWFRFGHLIEYNSPRNSNWRQINAILLLVNKNFGCFQNLSEFVGVFGIFSS